MFDSAFLAATAVTFEQMVIDAGYGLVNPARLVNLVSRQTIDPAVDTNPLQQIDMFAETDRITGAKGPFVLTDEPRWVRGQNISSSVAFAFLATWFEWDDQGVFAADPSDVALINRVLAQGFMKMQLTNRTIDGPVRIGSSLNPLSWGQSFSEINAAADDAMTNANRPLRYHKFSTPRLVDPQTELTPNVFLPGDLFGLATTPFFFFQVILAFAADIKG